MIILDTMVLSALMRHTPDSTVLSWLDKQPQTSIWTTAVTVFEIRYGLETMPPGKRQTLLLQSFEALLQEIGHRIAPFDNAAAQHASHLMAIRQKKGRLVEVRDTMIGGIVLANNAIVATRNLDHFEDLPLVINPWAT